GVYGLIKPQGTVGDSNIIVSKKAGAMYVVVDGTLHPVLNLASARLISDSDESPKSIAEKKLTGYPRGPLLGIPGAPVALPGPGS
ncbi:type VII secretion protein EccB, partial [Priestia sp. SIMBA_032]|uniref:type VII secretion protein EccB n=1 Tax=Priestia sp. SIMBA_032 TaxID=3085775 RepID=UPI00397DCA00